MLRPHPFSPAPRQPFWQRLAGMMAVTALLFAAGITGAGSPGHSRPAAPIQQTAHHIHDCDGHGSTAQPAASHERHIDHHARAAADDGAPCATGCMMCQHCGFCAVSALQAPLAAPLSYTASYAMPAAPVIAGIMPPLPAEPPRV
jgi:hypothetical protein